MIDDLIYFK